MMQAISAVCAPQFAHMGCCSASLDAGIDAMLRDESVWAIDRTKIDRLDD